ncbi:hypothetical protein MCERE85_01377 [Candidatus Nanopelagicaceae bacterium]
MSTKTTFKRVALVAVAALGFGMLSVVPSSAATLAGTSITAGTSSPSRVGSTSYTKITVAHAAAAANDTFTAAVKITSAPATSTTNTATNTSALGATIVATNGVTAGTGTVVNTYAAGGASAVVTQATATATSTSFYVAFVADVAGSYTFLVSSGNSAYTAGDTSASFTITTTGTPTSVTASSLGGSAIAYGTKGQLFAVSLKDANGNATVLGLNEAITFSDADTTTTLKNFANNATISSFGLNSDIAGVYYVRAVGSSTAADGSAVLTFVGSGLLPSTLTVNTTITTAAATDPTAATVTAVCTTSTNCGTGSTTGAAGTLYVKGATGLTIGGLTGSTTVAVVHPVEVTTNAGLGYSSKITIAAATTAATTTTFTSPAVTSTLTGAAFTIGDDSWTVTYQAPVATTIAVQGQASVLSATAGKNTFVVKVSDQYAGALAYQSVSVSVAGRNTVAATALGVTDANGLISYSLTDAGTTGTKDTFSFTTASLAAATATVNYGTVTVSTVTVTGGATADTVDGTTVSAINAADNGPEASRVAIKAVVKDASGNLLAGVPVVFTVDKGAIYKTAAVDYATVYTGSDGAATTYAFNWAPGKQTVTATAGGVAKTGYINWAATTATSARVLSVTATGDIVSVKVVDRFGNGVKGVSVNLSRTGTGLFGNGSSTQTAVTDKNGTSDVRFSGSGTVVAELDTATYDQAADVAGEISATAVTAAVAGTTKGTGASLAPAGVSKATIAIEESANSTLAAAQSASDAAAEATDAANAATDAANAAAEAADAATAAAQDAADAVAALSTQVSEMIDALKKQITALTNLVIKIQKKVKA